MMITPRDGVSITPVVRETSVGEAADSLDSSGAGNGTGAMPGLKGVDRILPATEKAQDESLHQEDNFNKLIADIEASGEKAAQAAYEEGDEEGQQAILQNLETRKSDLREKHEEWRRVHASFVADNPVREKNLSKLKKKQLDDHKDGESLIEKLTCGCFLGGDDAPAKLGTTPKSDVTNLPLDADVDSDSVPTGYMGPN